MGANLMRFIRGGWSIPPKGVASPQPFERSSRRLIPAGVAILILLIATTSDGHPLSQGSLDVTIQPDRVAVKARVKLEEVTINNLLTAPELPATPATQPTAASGGNGGDVMGAALDQHARYLAAHIHVTADGRVLVGQVTKVVPPAAAAAAAGGGAARLATSEQFAVYEIDYTPAPGPNGLPAPFAAPPLHVQLSQDVLVGVDYLPGTSWEATYVVRITQPGGRSVEGLLLTTRAPLNFDTADSASVFGPWQLFKEYLGHGLHHILTGYDHLLFISALVLGAGRLWDLVKVVTAFTLAHTATLTLAALRLVHLPEHVVEPLIAGSIVFVAVQNVFWPKRSRGWGRLGAAFFFGLFHGLGFAGGLLEAMQGMHGGTIVLAILAFSLGVELGHQMIVLPLFAGLKAARRTRDDLAAKERFSILAQRIGSAFISVAGMFYLVVALWPSVVRAS